MIKKKILSAVLVVVLLASALCIGIHAAATYNYNLVNPEFTVMGSLQGHQNSSNLFTTEYGTLRVDVHVDNPTYSRMFCTVRLFAMRKGYQVRVDHEEFEYEQVFNNNYRGTDYYTFTTDLPTSLSSYSEAYTPEDAPYHPNYPVRDLYLN